MDRQIILASTSPRRRDLLKHLGLKSRVVASNYREIHHKHLKPEALVKFLALGKAEAVAKKYPRAIVIGADTIVVYQGKVFGKPKHKAEAMAMLKELSGTTHYVYSAVVVIDSAAKKKLVKVIKSKIYFRKLQAQGIKNYIATGEPMDRAGAYAVQDKGAGLIKKVQGDYTSVVGLPLDALSEMLKKFGARL